MIFFDNKGKDDLRRKRRSKKRLIMPQRNNYTLRKNCTHINIKKKNLNKGGYNLRVSKKRDRVLRISRTASINTEE